MGQPDPERICTSIVERSNLSPPHGSSPVHAADEWLLARSGRTTGRAVMPGIAFYNSAASTSLCA